jgi:transcriptional regulator of acetoin/glycerol metabolism
MLSLPFARGTARLPSQPGTGPFASRIRALSSAEEAATIRAALEEYSGNIQQTARSLGLSRQALYRRMEKHGIRRKSGQF